MPERNARYTQRCQNRGVKERMQPLFHKLALPPILIGIHVVVLLPLFFAPPLEHPGDELLPPDAHRRTPDQPQDSFVGRLQPKFSVPFGVSGFLVVFVFKQLAGKVPLPKDPRNVRLASAIECTILFLLGVLEEIWRWGLVRILIRLQGGGGGFRGRGELWDLEKVLWNETGSMNTNYPSIWEAVYFMGWSWSVMEGVVRLSRVSFCLVVSSTAVRCQSATKLLMAARCRGGACGRLWVPSGLARLGNRTSCGETRAATRPSGGLCWGSV